MAAPGCTSPGVPDAKGSLPITGRIATAGGDPARGYVRLLDGNGDFVAEVPAGKDGSFTFYAVAGDWIVRAITSAGSVDRPVRLASADQPEVLVEVA